MNVSSKEINLINYLSKLLDKSHIIKKKDKYYINHESLCELCPFSYLQDFCKENQYKKNINLISSKKVIYFFDDYIHRPDTIGGNKITNTTGKVAIIFNIYFIINGVEYLTQLYLVDDYYPYDIIYGYIWIKIDDNPIAPFGRKAFKAYHFVEQNIKKFFDDYLILVLENNFNDGTRKIFDKDI